MINPLLCTDAMKNWKDGEEDSQFGSYPINLQGSSSIIPIDEIVAS
jgi:hypothetical protein